jgi:Schlafen, AlbA_2
MADVENLLRRGRTARRETRNTEFKEQFDPRDDTAWLELLKDFVAFANVGGGVIVIGLGNDGSLSNADVRPVLALDAATMGDKIRRFTGSNFDRFEVHEVERDGGRVAAIIVHEVDEAPLIFTRSGNYRDEQGRQKSAFTIGVVYTRHGAKSEPATSDDLRTFVDGRLDQIREEWLGNISEVMTAPPGSQIAVVTAIEEDEQGRPTRIRLTTDESAQPYGLLSPDETHPYRQTELVTAMNEALPEGVTVNSHDMLSVRRAHNVEEQTHPAFVHQMRFGSPQYSDAFVDWMVGQYAEDPNFFQQARDRYYEMQHSDS